MKGRTSSIKFNIKDILALILLSAWGFYLNHSIRITGLYKDDVYMWSFFRTDSFAEFILPATGKRCRPVYWFFQWLELHIIGDQVQRIIVINVILLVGIAVLLYFFLRKMSASAVLSWLAGMAFLSSRFAYYSVTQLIGLVETLAILFTLILCMQLYAYLRSGRRSTFYLACLTYVILALTHERYLVMLPMLFYCLIVSKRRAKIDFVAPAAAFVLVMLIRLKMTGAILPAGTGGTNVAETFTLKNCLESVLIQIKYLLGMSPGEEYLCGIEWENVAGIVKISVAVTTVLMLLLFARFVLQIIRNLSGTKDGLTGIRDFVFFAGFLIGCVAAASVTIRVEMRWIYMSFTMLLILLVYMYSYISRSKKIVWPAIVLAAVLLIMCSRDLYYRDTWNQIYLFTDESNLDVTDGLKTLY